MFTEAEIASCRRLIEFALEEDLGDAGDITSQATIPADQLGRAVFVARASGILAGLPAAQLVCAKVDPALTFESLITDGSAVAKGDRLANVSGSMRAILAAERTALNFVQRLSGIASWTRRFVDAIAGLNCKILDTRKTTPGWRLLEKYAVRQGGGQNHRIGLYDGILIKDNQIAAMTHGMIPIQMALRAARKRAPGTVPVEVEVETLEQLDQAFKSNYAPDIVLLDNMKLEELREAVQRRNANAPQILLEASGGVTLRTIRDIALTGVDRISVGELTHSAPALDIALDYEAK
jgi:nicotinate-nucleotide pyrophosphorylase (carboxylating)